MSATSKPKGHGHQVSVADAATLFGSAADDPFSSMLTSEPALDGVVEEAEEEPIIASKAELPPTAAAMDEASAETPKALTTALPEVVTGTLEVPASNAPTQNSSTSSPSALFTSSETMTDFFSGNHNNDDWFGGQTGETQYQDDEASKELNGQQYLQQPYDNHVESNGAEAGLDYNYYQNDQTQYGEQVNGFAEYQNGTYQQHSEYQQEQYDQYGQPSMHHVTQAEQYDPSHQRHQQQAYDYSAGQYDQYSEHQQAYDPAAYGYGQQMYDQSNGDYQPDSQLHAEQYNQYDPSMGQPAEYNSQQQYDPSMNQYDPSSHQQYEYEPTSNQYDGEDQQQYSFDPNNTTAAEQYESQPYDPALYGQGQEESLDSLGYTAKERADQEGIQHEATYPHYDTAAEEGLQPDPSTEVEEDHQLAASYPPDDFTGHQSQTESVMEKHTSSYDASPLPQGETFAVAEVLESYAGGPFNPSANGNYEANPYIQSIQDDYSGSAYMHEPYAADDIDQQHQGYAEYMPEEGHQADAYAEIEGLQGEDAYSQTAGPSGYFDNVAAPAPLQPEDDGPYSSRSLDVTSPYDPRLASAGFSSLGEAAYMSQDRKLDAAEERHRAKIPLASFSIDGKLLTFFPTWSQDTSEDTYANESGRYGTGSSGVPSKVTIRPLRTVVPANSYASSKNPLDFPGPALEGESSQGSALSRATGASASSNKAKKTALMKYLNDAATDMASGISYLAAGKQADEARRTKDRILMSQMLVLILEHDGNLVNNAAFDSAARNLLLSEMDGTPLDDSTPSDLDRSPIPGPSADGKAKFLSQMEGLLTAGQRKEAVDLAVKEKMWTHAVIIASGMDRATWREVVGQFVEDEFEQSATSHQGLKVAYHLFSGQEPKTTYDLFRRKASLSADTTQGREDGSGVSLSQWRKSVATVLANRSNGDSATLTAIGDGLAISGWIEAAHVCYLLSPQTSLMDGYDGGSSRLTLLGANSPEASTLYVRDLDHIILTEIFEYALSLQPVAKGAEAYHGLAYLQSYRLVHAYLLAEMGDVKQAIRYCDSIMTLLKHGKMNRYYHPVLLHQLQELSNRLQGDTKSVSWTKKKPTMDGVWSALEGRFTKFIAGEETTVKDVSNRAKGGAGPAIGPFSHYSAITPEARQGGMSRVQSTNDFRSGLSMNLTTSRPHSRPTSAMSLHPVKPLSANARSVSEYGSQANSALSSPKHAYSMDRNSSDADLYNGPFSSHSTNAAPWHEHDDAAEDGQMLQPAKTAYYGYEPHGATQSQFISNVDDDLSNAVGRVSLDDQSVKRGTNSYQPQVLEEEDEDDLGFGNKSTRAKTGNTNNQNESNAGEDRQSKEVATPEKKKEGELKPASSWFALPKLWGRTAAVEGETKAKKAHLGDNSSFYYDAELKRWVNKAAGDTGKAAASPPPPPPTISRAQTASPTAMGGNMPSSIAEMGPRRTASDLRPPPSSISEAGEDLGDSPTKAGRTRSNLGDGPPALQPGPPSRLGVTAPRSASSSTVKKGKRPIASRYVAI